MGAPFDKNETEILERIYPKIKSYLRPEGIISCHRKQGNMLLILMAICNTTRKWWRMRLCNFDEKGITKCGIVKKHTKTV